MVTVETVIVGSGFAGLGAAVRLDRAGRHDYLILEKGRSLGGTWRDNAYPGCACDIESHLYSFSFYPNPDWSRSHAPAGEILDYLERTADRFGLRDRIRFGVEVTGAEWDGEGWEIRTADGTTYRARYLLLALGPLHEPSVPDIDGLAGFGGAVFHSARWDHSVDLAGKRVAVVGTGASAAQIVPAIAPQVGSLTVVQRTPHWVLPKGEAAIPERTRRRFRRFPALMRLHRARLFWRHEVVVAGLMHPRLMLPAERAGRAYLDRMFAGRPELRERLTPTFALGCKRILLTDDYYPALLRDNVEVVTGGIARVTERGLVTTDGREHDADVIVFATGFKVGDGLARLVISGREGVKLADAWREGPEAFLGTTVAGFPNLFTLLGPNTGLAHSSMLLMAESQLEYVVDAMRAVDARGAAAIDTRRRSQEEYNAAITRRLDRSVWGTGGCTSWYLDPNGRNRILWPGATLGFRRRTRRIDPRHHEFLR